MIPAGLWWKSNNYFAFFGAWQIDEFAFFGIVLGLLKITQIKVFPFLLILI